jgi:hypothetical protein
MSTIENLLNGDWRLDAGLPLSPNMTELVSVYNSVPLHAKPLAQLLLR